MLSVEHVPVGLGGAAGGRVCCLGLGVEEAARMIDTHYLGRIDEFVNHITVNPLTGECFM
jgi:hypothetical protein